MIYTWGALQRQDTRQLLRSPSFLSVLHFVPHNIYTSGYY